MVRKMGIGLAIGVRHLQDPAREVMVIIDAAIALAALSHVVTIEPRIGHRGRTRVTAIAASATSRSIGFVLLGSPPEEYSTAESSESNHSDDNSGRNCGSVLALRGLFIQIFIDTALGGLRGCGLCYFTGSGGSSRGSPVSLRRRFAIATAFGCGCGGFGVRGVGVRGHIVFQICGVDRVVAGTTAHIVGPTTARRAAFVA